MSAVTDDAVKLAKPAAGCCAAVAVAGAPGARAQAARMVIVSDANGQPTYWEVPIATATAYSPVTATLVLAGGGDEDKEVEVAALPGVWIGVRTTSVPPALSAHIGEGGIMIENIVEGSPADQAGLERYDVITSFGGRKVDSMESLIEAVGGSTAGRSVEMVVTHAGKEKRFSVTPAKRPADDAQHKYKYEEQAADDFARYFGHQALVDPQGNLMLQPLGRLKDIPDVFKWVPGDDDDEDWHGWIKSQIGDALKDLDVKIDLGGGVHAFVFRGGDDEDDDGNGDKKVEIRVRVQDDGKVCEVRRTADGQISVERTEADGSTTTKTYGSEDELKAGDAEAFELYTQNAGGRPHTWLVHPPAADQLRDRQRQFELKIERQAQKAREMAEEARTEAERVRKHAAESAAAAQKRVEKRKGAAEDLSFKSVSVNVDDNGRIRITLRKAGGAEETYEFANKEAFKAQKPELYEKLKGFVDGDK
jgi:membrane-associated protease RseP (regulator of RpoE activity)